MRQKRITWDWLFMNTDACRGLRQGTIIRLTYISNNILHTPFSRAQLRALKLSVRQVN